jgi:hypothetical protein
MAAVDTVTRKDTVFGNKRVILLTCTASDTETYDTGYHNIESFVVSEETGTAAGGTFSGGTITFQTSGSDVVLHAIIVCSN